MTSGEVVLTNRTFPRLRRRLVIEIHRRAYHESGVEVSPGPLAPELDRHYQVGTPHCKKGDRTLGTLSWGKGEWARSGARFPSWQEFQRTAFDALGISQWHTREHKNCFHRRGKARHDLIFAVASLLVDGVEPCASAHMWTVGTDRQTDQSCLALLAEFGEIVPVGRPPRHLAVSCCGAPLAVLRSDGWTATIGGVLALDDLWWSGMSISGLASAIRKITGHAHRSWHEDET